MNIKASLQSVLLFSSIWVSMHSHAMGRNITTGLQIVRAGYNSRIGRIDSLMLKRAILQQGYTFTRQKIENHLFERDVMYGHGLRGIAPRQMWTETNPYIIRHCIKDDGSELSKAVFDMIRIIKIHGLSIVIENPVNDIYSDMLDLDTIDQCTTWQKVDDSRVGCTACFYDKMPLLVDAYKIGKKLEGKRV